MHGVNVHEAKYGAKSYKLKELHGGYEEAQQISSAVNYRNFIADVVPCAAEKWT